MKNITALIVAFSLVSLLQAQYSVTVNITGLPATPVTDAVYVAGSFNNWNPKDDGARLQKDANGRFSIQFKEVDAGPYEFKFTRGSWNSAETDEKGKDLPNRKITISADTSLQFSIAGWKDGFAQKPVSATASAQVTVMDTAFAVPQLGATRRIWIYLPKDYRAGTKKYPVLYMHDGQNLFDNATSFAGEWGIDEAMDSIKNACIVVGIDNGGARRMNEYNPNSTQQFGAGQGRQYLAFIVETLKPFIDTHYRTLQDSRHTWMAGSSMGGLISFYAGLYYPEVFGALGVFSPSFWLVPDMQAQLQQLAKKNKNGKQLYYFYAGGSEGGQMVPDMQATANAIKKIAHPAITININPQGKHNEASWRAVFPSFYRQLK